MPNADPPRGGAEETRLLKTLLNGHPDLIIISLDLAYHCLAFNRRAVKEFQELFGWTLCQGADVLAQIKPASIRRRLRAGFDRAFAGEVFTVVRHQPELDMHYEVCWVPLRSTEGGIIGATAYFLNVSDRMQAEEQLRKLSVAVEQSPASVVITDLNGTIEYVNTKFTRLTGYSLEEVLGENPRILNSGKLTPEVYQDMWETLAAGKEWFGEFHNRKKNGELFWEDAAISPIFDAAGKMTHYLAIKEDITARKEMEEQLRQSQKMEAVGQLAGGVAHDFNNLLTVINGYSDMVLSTLDASDPTFELMKEISTAGERAASLTRQLMAFSRKQVLQPRVLDVNELIQGMDVTLRRLVDESVVIETRLAPDLGLVKADPEQIEHVVLNLVRNALDAMPEGGSLEIVTRNVTLAERDLHDPGPLVGTAFICLSVRDTGTGLSREVSERIFEPFFTTKDVEKGTGLGLATVYGIVRQSGGDIRLQSAMGEGTVFEILLPRIQDDLPSSESTSTLQAPSESQTILIVEDESAVRELAAASLVKHGYTVLTAADGFDAIRQFENYAGRIHLLLSDVIMPNMNGKELVDQLSIRHHDVRVLFMSGYTDDSFADTGVLDPDTPFIQKPFTSGALAGKVRQILGG